MELNFAFLKVEFPILFNIASSAEYNLHQDPVTTLFKLRQFAEKLTDYVVETHNLEPPAENTFHNRVRALEDECILQPNIAGLVHNIKRQGNQAVHRNTHTKEDAKSILFSAFKVAKWFYQTYSEKNDDISQLKFSPPREFDATATLQALEKEYAELENKFQALLAQREAELDVGNAFKSIEFEKEGIRLLRGENIEPGALRWNKTVYFPKNKLRSLQHLFIREGDVILAMDRPLISTGLKVAMAKRDDLPCVLVQRVARFRPFESLDSSFLYYVMKNETFINHLLGEQRGTQIPHISSKQILDFRFSLPDINTQREIVGKIESLFAIADRIEARYTALKERIDRLPQAILAKAFRGELVGADVEKEMKTYEMGDGLSMAAEG